MNLTIIIPVYNVEKYVRTCIESLFRQGLDDGCFEIIIVNDGSKDRSMEMIADIVVQHENVTIINQENQGISVARNKAISIAKGEYILMLDSDDLIVDNSIPVLLGVALADRPDFVVADFVEMTNEEIEKYQGVAQKDFAYEEIRGDKIYLELFNPWQCYVWRALYRRDFLISNYISFIPGIRYEDISFSNECYLKADRCIKTQWLLNIYRKRPESITGTFTKSHVRDFGIALGATWDLQLSTNLPSQVRYQLEENVFVSFSLLIYNIIKTLKTSSEREEAVKIINSVAPHLNFRHNLRQKMTTFLLKNFPFVFIDFYYLYSKIVYKSRSTQIVPH